MAHLDVHAGNILVQAPPSPRQDTVMKRLRARRVGSQWSLPGHRALDVVDVLHHARPTRSAAFEALEYRMRHGGEMVDVQASLALKNGLEQGRPVPRLAKPLYPYQEHAVAFLDRAGSGILADEPGLGKTLQGIAFARMANGPTLVVCPATAKHVWAREIAACNGTAAIIQGRSARVPDAEFVIINYDVLADHKDALRRRDFTTLLADEAHHAKNIRAARTKALIQIADTIPRRLLMSGTLIMNEADDLYPPLRIVRPRTYPSASAFLHRYMTSRSIRKRVRGRWRSVTVREGSQNLPELHERMASFTIRRTLADVRDELPELRHTVVPLDLPADLATRSPIQTHDPASRMQQVQERMAVTVEAKARVLPQLLRERLAAGRKVLVFSTRLRLLDAVDEDPELQAKSVRIDGAIPATARRDIEDRFQQDPDIRLFLGQTRACSEALTLDAADTVIIAEADWSPQANEQAIRRAMRVNTQHPVEVLWLVVQGTLDEARMEVLARKREQFGVVMDGAAVLDEALALAATPGC